MKSRIGTYLRQHHLAFLCLFLILGGGTAWALERNSVGTRHLKNGAVTSAKVRDHSLRLGDIAPGQLPTEQLPSGKTLTGEYAMGGVATAADQFMGMDSISFVYHLASPPNPHFLPIGTFSSLQCPGVGQAQPGHLCVYEGATVNVGVRDFLGNPSRYGAGVYVNSLGATSGYSKGSWAVTAP